MRTRTKVGLSMVAVIGGLTWDYITTAKRVMGQHDRPSLPSAGRCEDWCPCKCNQTGCGCHENRRGCTHMPYDFFIEPNGAIWERVTP